MLVALVNFLFIYYALFLLGSVSLVNTKRLYSVRKSIRGLNWLNIVRIIY